MADPNRDPRKGREVMPDPSQGPGRRQDITDASPTWSPERRGRPSQPHTWGPVTSWYSVGRDATSC